MLKPEQYAEMKKWKKANVRISKELRDIIHGYIMSDGYVHEGGSLCIEQGAKQEKFVEWMYQKLEILRTDTSIGKRERRLGKGNTYSRSFNTQRLLIGFHRMWYKPYVDDKGQKKWKKRLPKSLKAFFNPTFITLWFAGDGTKILGSRGAKFEVTSFTPDERHTLQVLFKEKLGLSVKINRAGTSKSGTHQWTLCINADQYDKFREVITQMDLIPNLFPYKLHPVRKSYFS